ncbi:MAG TPA: hypothetical protein DEA05_05040 [Rhodobacteraceae bacterium]|jgi:hypothetical protein|nr:hypothetical protein [Paracoccaceae bacterium]
MHRKFIALIVATAVAVTGLSAAPARADEDTARIIAGIAALALLGAAIREHNRDDDPPVVHRPTRPGTTGTMPHRPNLWADSCALPAQCLREHRVGCGERITVLGARCLNRHYRHAGQLPQQCRERVWTRNGLRQGYDPRCLRQNGYRLARR